MIKTILAGIGALVVLSTCFVAVSMWLSVRAERRRKDRVLSLLIAEAEIDGEYLLLRDWKQGKTYPRPKERAA